MSFGLLGKISNENAHLDIGGHQVDVVADIDADAAYMEMAELASEADETHKMMAQALAIAEKLEDQSKGLEHAMDNPEMVTPTTVVVARESMVLAQVALGGQPEEFSLSSESIETNPLQALEVTHEGIKDTAKKIYEAIKMAFQKIGQAIKKLAAKALIVITNIDKKAEALYNKYKDKKLQKVKDIDQSLVADVLKPRLGLLYLREAGNLPKGAKEREVVDALANNLRKYIELEESIIKLFDEADEAAEGKTGKEAEKAALKTINSKFSKLKDIIESMVLVELPKDMAPNQEAKTTKFIPTYIKGSRIGGIALGLSIQRSFFGGIKFKTLEDAHSSIDIEGLTIDVTNDDTFYEKIKNKEVPEFSTIMGILKSNFKGANKVIKAIADSRQRDLEKLSKEVDREANRKSGLAFLNKMKATRYNKLRVIAAGHFINQIFTGVNLYKGHLASLAKTLKTFYEEK